MVTLVAVWSHWLPRMQRVPLSQASRAIVPCGRRTGQWPGRPGTMGAAVASPEIVPIFSTGRWAKNILFTYLLQTNPHVKF